MPGGQQTVIDLMDEQRPMRSATHHTWRNPLGANSCRRLREGTQLPRDAADVREVMGLAHLGTGGQTAHGEVSPVIRLDTRAVRGWRSANLGGCRLECRRQGGAASQGNRGTRGDERTAARSRPIARSRAATDSVQRFIQPDASTSSMSSKDHSISLYLIRKETTSRYPMAKTRAVSHMRVMRSTLGCRRIC